MTIKGLTFNCGGKIVPGTIYIMYFVASCDIETFPAIKTTTAIGDGITLDGNIVLKAGKTFKRVTIITNTGRIKHEGVGTETSKSYSNALDIKMPKDIASDEWFNDMQNFEGVVLVREKVGRYRTFGNIDSPAFFEVTNGDTGAVLADENAWNATLKDEVGNVAPIYTGNIVTEILSGGFSSGFSSGFNI
jgi:hypothetical protein